MNTTTIHFVQEQNNLNQLQINSQSTANYNWSNLESNNVSLPIQQVHYVEPNLTLINNTSTKLIQMSQLEPSNQSIATKTANNSEPTYLTPLINLTLNESINYYSDNIINNSNNNNSTLSTLPSMATNFGSPIFGQQSSNVSNVNLSLSNNKAIKKLGKTKLNKINWTSKRKSTATGNKLNEQKLKYSNETSLNSLNMNNKITKKTSQLIKGRKRIPKNLVQNLTTSSTATLTNSSLNSTINSENQYQPNKNITVNLNNSTNSIESANSLYSLNSCSNSSIRKGKKSSNDPNDPTVKRRNQRERIRVHKLNIGFEHLRAKLPNSNKKMPKVQTLRCATQYIKNLLAMLNQPTSSTSSTFYL